MPLEENIHMKCPKMVVENNLSLFSNKLKTEAMRGNRIGKLVKLKYEMEKCSIITTTGRN